MENIITKIFDGSKIKIYIYDFAAVTLIYFVPALSHMLSLPVYLIEPMRLVLVGSIIFAGRNNSYVLALTLPLFSYLISSHPVFAKTLLISSELLLNVIIFYQLKDRFQNTTLVFAVSIIAAKLYYYIVKYLLLQFFFLNGSLISTPIVIQIFMAALFTASFHLLFRKSE